MRRTFFLLITFLCLILFSAVRAEEIAHGIVFNDRNANGVMDKDEAGIAGVPVSNQAEVVLTDKNGRFELPVTDRCIIFLSKPSGYQVPLDDKNLPQFYYRHFPKGSPAGLQFPGIEPTGDLPKLLTFPLQKIQETKQFTAIITGDPQPATDEHLDFFRDDIISDMLQHKTLFYLALGDIVWDNLSLYKRYTEAVSKLGRVAYNVHGNHDMNFHVPSDEFATETFRRVFGPEYYSFDYGDVHFVILEDVAYQGWNEKENKKGQYTGFLHNKQLQWLRNDLKFVPEHKLIVLSKHIPIATDLSAGDYNRVTNRDELFDILKDRKKLLALSGHTHTTEAFKFGERHGWTSENEFISVNPGAACGAWWSGPKDIRGLPAAMGTDGSPNGYYIFEFDGNNYSYRFHPANLQEADQISVTFPRGKFTQNDTVQQHIIVNVFAGGIDTKVVYQIDDGSPVEMTYTKMADPFVVHYMQENRDWIADWIRNSAMSTHLWQAEMPKYLSPGMHTIKIVATDHQKHEYNKTTVFEIEGKQE
ncbi:MAG: calcineurin-like phosphoesterase C-terminal domain-containing protein [Deferribacteres bacterium]|nr:calcineurin-like phosphoesterase C-terminal domain-containing protein [candidate division KSB1 bacterium]MCB9504240.1 calcineurin-like phosphoesterase C-terminal domain-containing protein [Deferribacteres bacterium]